MCSGSGADFFLGGGGGGRWDSKLLLTKKSPLVLFQISTLGRPALIFFRRFWRQYTLILKEGARRKKRYFLVQVFQKAPKIALFFSASFPKSAQSLFSVLGYSGIFSVLGYSGIFSVLGYSGIFSVLGQSLFSVLGVLEKSFCWT